MKIEEIRKDIDDIDVRIVELINKRAALAQEAGRTKQSTIKYRPAREAEVIRNIRAQNKGPISGASVEAVFREIISGCLSLERPLTVSFLGPAGTYSQDAARKQFGSSAVLLPHPTIDDVLRGLESGSADVAVLPIENSIEGSVNRTLDLLLQTKKRIIGEIVLPIHHQLLTTAKSLDTVTEVAAHPQALAQCRVWLQKNLPHAKQVAMNSNGEAAAAVKKPHMAAIAGKTAAQTYCLSILAADIEDDATNTTRFVVLGTMPVPPTGQDKTSLIISVANKPGALGKVIPVLSDASINMTKLESRPSPSGLWDYVFYIDIDGHQDDAVVAKTLHDLESTTRFIKVAGSYPKATV